MLDLKIPPPIIWILSALAMLKIAGFPSHPKWLYLSVSLGISILAIVIAILAITRFRHHKTTIHPHHLDRVCALVTDGIYRYTRNPMYLSLLLLLFSFGIFLGNWLTLFPILFFIGYLTQFQIKPEEYILAKRFGDDFMLYKDKVRRWI
ncbi:MAG: hypothetical protein CENE_02563 [Candidatus Celerinatantimonas neptuna]|nr:MAG: hypothetical protein CENE_02563 [Candidatus Celerinatantimonas neptuna]